MNRVEVLTWFFLAPPNKLLQLYVKLYYYTTLCFDFVATLPLVIVQYATMFATIPPYIIHKKAKLTLLYYYIYITLLYTIVLHALQ